MNPRRNQRVPFAGKVSITWENGAAYAVTRGTCLDISKNGICVKITDPIPVGTYVGLSIEPLGFRSTASVRHMVRGMSKFTVGLELLQAVPAQALIVP
jgi:hypothetical protein